MLFSLQIAVVKRIAALGAELRRMCRISRFPAAFVALILRDAGGLGFATLGAEFALIHRTAGARPAVYLRFWFFCAAFRAELSACRRAALRAFPASCRWLRLRLFAAAVRAEIAGDTALSAAARPTVRGRCRCCGSGLLCLLLRAHLIEILRVHAAHLSGHIHAHERHRGACALIGRGRLHRCRLCADQMCRRSRRIHECRVALHFFQHLLVFFARLHAGYAERYNLKSAQVAPLAREHLVERICQLHRVTGQRRIADAHVGNSLQTRAEAR